jgi:hypothetical protein
MREIAMLTASVAATIAFSPAQAYDCSPATFAHAKPQMALFFGSGALAKDPNPTDFVGLSVLVDDTLWARMNFPAKKQFADQLVCAIAGVGKGLTELHFKSLSTGRLLGIWKADALTIP